MNAALLTLALLPKVHVHAAGEAGFYANAYLVEGDHGVVAVDAPLTVSEAKSFRKELDALGKPLLGVLVTHAHPDHVNGIGILVDGTKDVPVVALDGVVKQLKAIDEPKRAYWTPIYKSEYPAKTTFPNRIVAADEPVVFDGMTFHALDLGRGESESETVWTLNEQAFVGDLLMNHVHAWVAEGHTGDWLAALERAEVALVKAKVIYPGHGAVGTVADLAWQRRYLETYRAAIRSIVKGPDALDDAKKKSLTEKLEAFLPRAKLAILVGMGADSVAAELAKK